MIEFAIWQVCLAVAIAVLLVVGRRPV